jgi:hypothetical protein
MKLGTYIMPPELISTAWLKNPSHQSVCLYVCPPIVARQRLGNEYSRNNSRIVGRVVFNVVRCVSRKKAISSSQNFFSFLWGEVRLSPLGKSATNLPIVPAPDDRCVWSSRWNEDWQQKQKYSEKTCPCASWSTTNPTWLDLGSNPGRSGGKPATNRLGYGTEPSYHRWSDIRP